MLQSLVGDGALPIVDPHLTRISDPVPAYILTVSLGSAVRCNYLVLFSRTIVRRPSQSSEGRLEIF
jgi:hypothetical protein